MIKAVIFDMFETLITHYKSPLYFGSEMAKDAGISYENFQKIWRATDLQRTLGKLSFENVIKKILIENNVYSLELLQKMVLKRTATKVELFNNLEEQILPMLNQLHKLNVKIGLISNCYDEEASVIKKSVLFPFFDAVCLSCEIGVAKPDIKIYQKCTDILKVSPKECFYIGDGGCNELETAHSIGMQPLQATWYFCNHHLQGCIRKPQFAEVSHPLDVVNLILSQNSN